MRGVILAADPGSALEPLTRVTHPSLLPVYDRPLIFHPLRTLVDADVREILIVSGGPHAEAPRRLLGDGSAFGFGRLRHAVVRRARGPSHALLLAERFACGGPLCVIGAADLIERNIQRAADVFREDPRGATLLLKKVPDPEHHEVPKIRAGRIVSVVECPRRPPSRYAVTGIRFFDAAVFDRIRRLEATARHALSDLDDDYARAGLAAHTIVRGWWLAANTFDTLARANRLVASGGANKL